MTAVQARSLVKRYGDLVAVDDVSLEAPAGEVFVLLGPNGAGKTTTVEILEGLRSADAGEARVLAAPSGSRETAQRVGVMPQTGDLYAGIRVEEAVRLFASFYERPADADVLIDRLRLGRVRKTTYRRLSGGERRRLSLALALVGDPEVLFLDEPTAEMDIEGRAATWELVGELKQRGTAILLTTHLLDEAERVADRVGVMNHGKLVACGTLDELTSARAPEITFTASRPFDTDGLSRALGATVTAEADSTYRIHREADPALVARLTDVLAQQDVLVRQLRVGGRTLTEIYLELTSP